MDYVVVLWEIWQMPKMAFPWQHFSPGFRTAAYEQLGELYMREENWEKAEQ